MTMVFVSLVFEKVAAVKAGLVEVELVALVAPVPLPEPELHATD